MDIRQTFRDLHKTPFVMPNPWDIGSARILTSLGFPALATSSAACANALGRRDGGVSREEALAHGESLASASSVPVSADLEDGFGPSPEDAARTVRGALETGLAGCSIEDFGGGEIFEISLAADRIRAAAEANRSSDAPLVLTARAENFFRGNPDLADTIARLQAYQEAGADVVYAPGISTVDQIEAIVRAVDRPVNVIIMPKGPSVPEIFRAGAMRISVGSWISLAAQAAIVTAAQELLDPGTHTFIEESLGSARAIQRAMSE